MSARKNKARRVKQAIRQASYLPPQYRFDLKSPCAECPFRSDLPWDYHPEAFMKNLDNIIQHGSPHSCHLTDPNADNHRVDPETAGLPQHCAGALIMLKKEGRTTVPVLQELAKGNLAPWDDLDMSAPVYDLKGLLAAFMAEMTKEDK